MATTFRQVINRVLRTMSEDEIDSGVTELADDYHKLVASFVNQIKEEIEDAHNWRVLRQTVSVTVTGGTNTGTITGANERSRLVRIMNSNYGYLVPLVFDVTNPNNPAPIMELDMAEMIYRESVDTSTTTEVPAYFAIDNTDSDVLKLVVYPTPSSNRTIQVTMVIPQAYLEDSDLDDVIKIPSRALILGSIWYSLQERGEELGVSNLYTEERYRIALDDAVTRDAEEQGGYELVPV